MKEINPVEHLLDQLGEALNILHQKKGKARVQDVPPEVLQRMERIKAMVAALKQAAKQFETGSVTEFDLNRLINRPEGSRDPKTRRILEKAQKLKDEVQALRKEFTSKEKVKGDGLTNIAAPDEKDKKTGQSRKKRAAKNIGHKGWKRL